MNCGLFAEEDDFGVWTFLGLGKKLSYSTVELYTALNEPNGTVNDKMPYTVGSLLGVGKHHSLSVYYRYVEVFRSASVSSHILGVGFRFNL